jgi:hypothetical protein
MDKVIFIFCVVAYLLVFLLSFYVYSVVNMIVSYGIHLYQKAKSCLMK